MDAFKTTEGGKASYITYVIKIGVGLFHPFLFFNPVLHILMSIGVVSLALMGIESHDAQTIFCLFEPTPSLNRLIPRSDHPSHPIQAVFSRLRGQRTE